MTRLAPLVALLLAGVAGAADLAKIDRVLAKEPAYKTKSQKYALVVVGPEAKQRLWLVLDGHDLHLLDDELTKLAAKKGRRGEEGGIEFESDEVRLGCSPARSRSRNTSS